MKHVSNASFEHHPDAPTDQGEHRREVYAVRTLVVEARLS
jgi:hypothetical protein